MDGVEEIPLEVVETGSEVVPDDTSESVEKATGGAVEAGTMPEKVKPKAKARGKRGPDKTPRAKPKPKAKAVTASIPPITTSYRESIIEQDSESSADEATLQELHSLQLLRSIRAYDQNRNNQKNLKYASWFGR